MENAILYKLRNHSFIKIILLFFLSIQFKICVNYIGKTTVKRPKIQLKVMYGSRSLINWQQCYEMTFKNYHQEKKLKLDLFQEFTEELFILKLLILWTVRTFVIYLYNCCYESEENVHLKIYIVLV